jgi:hypothetical protein
VSRPQLTTLIRRYEDALPLPVSDFTGRDLTEIELASYAANAPARRIDPSTTLSDEPASIPPAAATLSSSDTNIDPVASPTPMPLPPVTPSEDPGVADLSSSSALPGSFPQTPSQSMFPVGITDGSATPRPPSPAAAIMRSSSEGTVVTKATAEPNGESEKAPSNIEEQSADSIPEVVKGEEIKLDAVNGINDIAGEAKPSRASGDRKPDGALVTHVGYSCNHCRVRVVGYQAGGALTSW